MQKSLLKWPLIIAVILVVVRVVLEQLGMPETVNNVFGVAWLYFLVPIYFALHIAEVGEPKPFLSLLKITAIFAACTRVMIIPVYMLAYAFQWQAPRFSLSQGGVVGEGITPLNGYLLIPARNAIFWIVSATIVGLIIGGITLLIKRRLAAKATA